MEVHINTYFTSISTVSLALTISTMLYILSKGADLLVNTAVSLSIYWNVPKKIIGATIVSLGTTLPEATTSILAAINGKHDLALGNAIGSIIANTGLIVGLAALIGNLPVKGVVIERQGKMQVWAGILLAFSTLPLFSGDNGNISRWMGLVFIALLIMYIYISIKWCKNPISDRSFRKKKIPFPVEESSVNESILVQEKSSSIIQILKLFAGMVLVIVSSKIIIPAVEVSAVRVGIPQGIIAATLIAFGTSLPELVTAITAVGKGHGELAIGNVVGANILNVIFVVGSAAVVTPRGLDVPFDFYKLQIPTMLIILIIFRLFSKRKDKEITKKEGFMLLFIYLIYLILSFTWI